MSRAFPWLAVICIAFMAGCLAEEGGLVAPSENEVAKGGPLRREGVASLVHLEVPLDRVAIRFDLRLNWSVPALPEGALVLSQAFIVAENGTAKPVMPDTGIVEGLDNLGRATVAIQTDSGGISRQVARPPAPQGEAIERTAGRSLAVAPDDAWWDRQGLKPGAQAVYHYVFAVTVPGAVHLRIDDPLNVTELYMGTPDQWLVRPADLDGSVVHVGSSARFEGGWSADLSGPMGWVALLGDGAAATGSTTLDGPGGSLARVSPGDVAMGIEQRSGAWRFEARGGQQTDQFDLPLLWLFHMGVPMPATADAPA